MFSSSMLKNARLAVDESSAWEVQDNVEAADRGRKKIGRVGDV